jgi:hypothetical protein
VADPIGQLLGGTGDDHFTVAVAYQHHLRECLGEDEFDEVLHVIE